MGGIFYLKKIVKDIIFPINCIRCGKFDSFICSSCFLHIKYKDILVCHICKKELIDTYKCKKCNEKTYLNGVIVLCSYCEIIQKLIHEFKFKNIFEIEKCISSIIQKGIEQNIKYFKTLSSLQNTCIVPIPLHNKRKAERGFNQSEIIAKYFSQYFNYPIETKLIERIINTPHQSVLNKKQRIVNIKGCFFAKKNTKYSRVILIDDIFTTGATMEEAASCLKQNGVSEVFGIVIAQGK